MFSDILLVMAIDTTSIDKRSDILTAMTEIEALIKHHNMERNIQILGLVDVPNFLNSIDILVYPLQTIIGVVDIPPTIIEGLAAGCAVVSTRMGSIPEIIKHDKNGVLIPKGAHNDPKSYARAIIDLIQNPAKMKKIKQNAKRNLNEYDIERSFPEILRIYGEVVRTNQASATNPQENH